MLGIGPFGTTSFSSGSALPLAFRYPYLYCSHDVSSEPGRASARLCGRMRVKGEGKSAYDVEIHGILERRAVERSTAIPIEVPQPEVQPRVIVADHFEVAVHDVVVRHVEPDQRRVKPDVGFGNVLAEQIRGVARLSEMLL